MKIWHKQFLEKTQSSLLRLALSATIDIDIDIDIACRFLLSIPLAEMLSMQEPGDKQPHLLMPRNLTKFLAHHRHTPRPRDHRNQPINIGAELDRRGLQSISAVPMALRKSLTLAGGLPQAGDHRRSILRKASKITLTNRDRKPRLLIPGSSTLQSLSPTGNDAVRSFVQEQDNEYRKRTSCLNPC